MLTTTRCSSPQLTSSSTTAAPPGGTSTSSARARPTAEPAPGNTRHTCHVSLYPRVQLQSRLRGPSPLAGLRRGSDQRPEPGDQSEPSIQTIDQSELSIHSIDQSEPSIHCCVAGLQHGDPDVLQQHHGHGEQRHGGGHVQRAGPRPRAVRLHQVRPAGDPCRVHCRSIQISTFLGNFAFAFSFQCSYVCT